MGVLLTSVLAQSDISIEDIEKMISLDSNVLAEQFYFYTVVVMWLIHVGFMAYEAGALEAMLDLTVEYCEVRQQFGKPIGRFQAVQQHLVWTAQDAAITKMAAQVAARQAARGDGRFEIAAARSLANECASTATRQCHQAHGAMGMNSSPATPLNASR